MSRADCTWCFVNREVLCPLSRTGALRRRFTAGRDDFGDPTLSRPADPGNRARSTAAAPPDVPAEDAVVTDDYVGGTSGTWSPILLEGFAALTACS